MASYIASSELGKALFEAGITVNNARRFQRMSMLGIHVQHDQDEFNAYFDFEAQSLIAFEEDLMIAKAEQHLANDCDGFFAIMPSIGKFKCVECGTYKTEA